MKINVMLAAVAAAGLLTACVEQKTSSAIAVPANATAAQRLVASAGIPLPTGTPRGGKEGYNTAVNTGLAVGMTQSFGAAGLAGGVMGVLATPSDGPEASPQIIAQLPPGETAGQMKLRISEAVYKASGQNLESKGYRRVQVATLPEFAVYAKPDCPRNRRGAFDRKCATVFKANMLKAPGPAEGRVYLAPVAIGSDVRAPDVALLRRVVDLMPKDLSLYLPPQWVNGAWQPARLYQQGREVPLQ